MNLINWNLSELPDIANTLNTADKQSLTGSLSNSIMRAMEEREAEIDAEGVIGQGVKL